ncbi:MAG: hypothetical protein QM754_00215 [Tepidisphaeraceae bacterium]
MKNALILTATITPPAGAPDLKRVDPQLRRADYLNAFDFYKGKLGSAFDRLVFADNSNSDVSEFVAASDGDPRMTVLSFQANDHDPKFGRGYGEFRLIDEVVRQAPDLIEGFDRCWKVTGRYTIENIESLLLSGHATDDLIIHCRNRPRYWADLYCMGWTRQGYDRVVKGIYHRLRSDLFGMPPEIIVRAIVDDLKATERFKVCRRFRTTPLVNGIRGVDSTNYLDPRHRWKIRYRRIAEYVAPWLWI